MKWIEQAFPPGLSLRSAPLSSPEVLVAPGLQLSGLTAPDVVRLSLHGLEN